MLNALKYIRGLEAVGFRRDQAEAQVQLVIDAFEEDVASKTDLNEVKFELKAEMTEIKSQFALIESQIVFKLGRVIVVCSTLMLTAICLMLKFQ